MLNLSGFEGRTAGFCGVQLLVNCHLGTHTVATLTVLFETIEYGRYHCKLVNSEISLSLVLEVKMKMAFDVTSSISW